MPEAETPTSTEGQHRGRSFHLPRFRWVLVGALALVLVLWVVPVLEAAISDPASFDEIDYPYLIIFAFVVFDAIVPIFPSESILTTASTAASQGSSDLVVGYIALAGAVGSITGDSALYWISRTVGRGVFSKKLEQAESNEKVAVAMKVLGDTAPLLISVGRFVPGVRFAVNVTMALGRYPYPKFLLYSAIGGTAWAAYTCWISALTGEAFDGYPVLSILTSSLITAALLGLMYYMLKRRYEARTTGEDSEVSAAEPRPSS